MTGTDNSGGLFLLDAVANYRPKFKQISFELGLYNLTNESWYFINNNTMLSQQLSAFQLIPRTVQGSVRFQF